jgi:hypothetical protein
MKSSDNPDSDEQIVESSSDNDVQGSGTGQEINEESESEEDSEDLKSWKSSKQSDLNEKLDVGSSKYSIIFHRKW